MPENQIKCKFCGSTEVWKAGFVIKSNPYRKVQRYQCKNCGRHFDEEQLKREGDEQ
jgi:transposase-like protein